MIALALIILVLALLLTTAVFTGNGDSITVDLFGSEVNTSVSGLYLTGLLVGLATLLALVLLRIGLKKGWRQRKRIKELQRRAEQAGDPERQPVAGTDPDPIQEAADTES